MKKSKKARKRLETRRLDYEKMISGPKKDYSGYKRPGSLSK